MKIDKKRLLDPVKDAQEMTRAIHAGLTVRPVGNKVVIHNTSNNKKRSKKQR